jgi:hypothetical protein
VVTIVGFLAFPILLTWTWYRAGFSMLAVLALTPLVGWLWVRGSFALAGALLGIAVLFKLNLALVLVAAPAALLILRVPAGPVRPQLTRAAIGLGGALTAVVVVMALRGELSGYFDVLSENAKYSRDALEQSGRRGGILGHLQVATQDENDAPWTAVRLLEVTLLMGGLLAAGWLWRRRAVLRNSAARSASDVLAGVSVSACVATFATLAFTAVWVHHTQMLAYPVLLVVAFLVTLMQGARAGVVRALAACVAVGVAFALVWDARTDFFDASSAWRESARSETADVLERVADKEAPGRDEITFAHLGENDELGMGAFLDDRFALACPDVAQYSFSLDPSTLDCIQDEKPRLVLVTPSFAVNEEGYVPTKWSRFVADADALLKSHYDRVARSATAVGPVDVWSARASFGAAGQ